MADGKDAKATVNSLGELTIAKQLRLLAMLIDMGVVTEVKEVQIRAVTHDGGHFKLSTDGRPLGTGMAPNVDCGVCDLPLNRSAICRNPDCPRL